MILIAKWTVILFGVFLIGVGIFMCFAPNRARRIIRKAASTPRIHFTEISLRILPAMAMILYAHKSDCPLALTLFGSIMVVTSLVLFFVPREMHHQYALRCAAVLQPKYIRILSPISILLGSLLIKSVS